MTTTWLSQTSWELSDQRYFKSIAYRSFSSLENSSVLKKPKLQNQIQDVNYNKAKETAARILSWQVMPTELKFMHLENNVVFSKTDFPWIRTTYDLVPLASASTKLNEMKLSKCLCWGIGQHQDGTKETRNEQEEGNMSHPDYRGTAQNI